MRYVLPDALPVIEPCVGVLGKYDASVGSRNASESVEPGTAPTDDIVNCADAPTATVTGFGVNTMPTVICAESRTADAPVPNVATTHVFPSATAVTATLFPDGAID